MGIGWNQFDPLRLNRSVHERLPFVERGDKTQAQFTHLSFRIWNGTGTLSSYLSLKISFHNLSYFEYCL